MRLKQKAAQAAELVPGLVLSMKGRAIRWRDRLSFSNINWTWLPGQQWGVLGANGSGKSLLALAVWGKAPLVEGNIEYGYSIRPEDTPYHPVEDPIALLSPDEHRDLARHESSFYQSRWQSGLDEGSRTLADLLSYPAVAGLNPFEVGVRRRAPRYFLARRRELVVWLGLKDMMRRKLNALSNGETRKALLVQVLLRQPGLLILDDPFGGLDVKSRLRLKSVLDRLMQEGLAILALSSRPDELPDRTTHLLLVRDHQIIAQGERAAMMGHPLVRSLAASAAEPEIPPASSKRSLSSSGTCPVLEMCHVTIQMGRKYVLRDVSWTIRPGEHWAVLGPNGSGKTTLLSLIQGDHPQAHAVDLKLFGIPFHSTHGAWQIRQQCGWISPELHLHYPPGWLCWQVVCSGYFNSLGLYHACTPRQRRQARAQLHACRLENKADEVFGALSLGEQRMVLLARATVNRPRLLILDEPCQGLDAGHRQVLLNQVDRQVSESGANLIFVTHHAREWPACITHHLKIRDGQARVIR